MALRDVGGALGSGGLAGLAVDLIVNGGDVILAVLAFLATNSDLFVLLFARLATLAPELAFLPQDTIQRLLLIAAVLSVVWTLARLYRRWRDD